MQKHHLERVNKFLLFVFFIIGLISTFIFKQLYNHGSSWAYRIFDHQTWAMDANYIRYSSYLLQTPAVISAKFGGSVNLTNWLFCFGYFIYPFIALSGLAFYLRKKDKKDMIYSFILSFALTIVSAWAFPNSISTESIVIMWILFAYIVSEEKPGLLVLGILSIAMLVSYEVGGLFFGFAAYLLWREKKLNKANFSLLIIITLAQAYNLLFRLIPTNGHEHFIVTLDSLFESPFLILIVFMLLIGVILSSSDKKMREVAIPFATLVSLITIYFIFKMSGNDLWRQSYRNRIWNIPACILILMACYEYMKHKYFQLDALDLKVLAILLLPAIFFEMRITNDAHIMISKIRHEVMKQRGCSIVSVARGNELANGSTMPSWELPFLSVLLGGQRDVQSVLFMDFEGNTRGAESFCILSEDKTHIYYYDEWAKLGISTSGHFNFSNFPGWQ
jgi:hypothetical protein